MQGFINNERLSPKKRLVVERVKDFEEIYEVFRPQEASVQSERCVQCGDPFCSNKCPLHNFIPYWLKATAEKDLELAFNISNETSPFPEVMGRVCPQDRLCEGDCTLNDGHGAITIGSIETYITEEGFKNGLKPRFNKEKMNRKVSIIGSGPASLSAATYLLRAGVDVEMYERSNRAGGLLTYGIPNFKLDKKIVERRVQLLKEAGLKLHLETEVGSDISFDEIANNSDAVFLGLGATKARDAKIPGENSEGVYKAMELLTNIQAKNFKLDYDKRFEVKDLNVVVIGGGDTAMDCVRTSLREAAKKVTCVYRRDAKNMPGSKKEYENAIEEGANFAFNASPKRIIQDENGKVIGIEMIKTVLGKKDASGRQSMEEVKGSEFRIDADIIIMSLGFSPEAPKFLAENGIETNTWGGITVDKQLQTSKEGVYAGGDCFRGANLVVSAAFDGREAAKAIIKSFK